MFFSCGISGFGISWDFTFVFCLKKDISTFFWIFWDIPGYPMFWSVCSGYPRICWFLDLVFGISQDIPKKIGFFRDTLKKYTMFWPFWDILCFEWDIPGSWCCRSVAGPAAPAPPAITSAFLHLHWSPLHQDQVCGRCVTCQHEWRPRAAFGKDGWTDPPYHNPRKRNAKCLSGGWCSTSGGEPAGNFHTKTILVAAWWPGHMNADPA